MNKLIFEQHHFPYESDVVYFIDVLLFTELKSEFSIDILKNLIN
jgi:hypothetical protein